MSPSMTLPVCGADRWALLALVHINNSSLGMMGTASWSPVRWPGPFWRGCTLPCMERDSVHCTTRQTRSHLRGQSRALPPFPRLSDAVVDTVQSVEAWSPGLLRLHVGPSPFSPSRPNRDKRVLSNLSQLAVTAARTQLKALVFLDTCGAPWPGMSVATQ